VTLGKPLESSAVALKETVDAGSRREEVQAAVDAVRLWYHTMDLPGGVVTPGHFDLRPIVERMPWPDVRGKRCLDVGTYDGFLAFELERRGAAEVIATDIPDHASWDFPARSEPRSPELLAEIAGAEKGHGFRIAKEALGSNVERIFISAYDLHPDRVGTFDVVVCGALMLHLRDPIRALEAIRSVCRGYFLSAEEVRAGLSVCHPLAPVAELTKNPQMCQWWVPNVRGHRHMVYTAGFKLESRRRTYAIPLGVAHAPPGRSPRAIARGALRRAVMGGEGLPTSVLLASVDPGLRG